jgi:hypothetical protein
MLQGWIAWFRWMTSSTCSLMRASPSQPDAPHFDVVAHALSAQAITIASTVAAVLPDLRITAIVVSNPCVWEAKFRVGANGTPRRLRLHCLAAGSGDREGSGT